MTWDLIKKSVISKLGKPSTSRISSYYILSVILIQALVNIVIDVFNAMVKWDKGETYEIPAAHIVIFTLVLSHHLILLGLKKSSDNDELKYMEHIKTEPKTEPKIEEPKTTNVDVATPDNPDLEEEESVD